MSYEINVLDDHTAILLTLNSDYDVKNDTQASGDEMLAILDAVDHQLPLIADLRDLKVDFASMVAGLALGTRGPSVVFGHPNISQIVFIADSGLIRIGTKALSQAQYGSIHVMVVDTLEEALAMVEA